MAVGFEPDDDDLIPFSIDLSGGGTLLVLPELGDDGVRSWENDIILASGDDASLLRAEQVRVTSRPATGRMDHGTIIIEGTNVGGNPGRFGDLTVPVNGGEETWRAALVNISISSELTASFRRSHVRFIVGNKVS